MATIKEQTEKTEQLKTSLDNKVVAIADEIKKQDNIDITRLSEVPDAIAQLKNSRKRWASGSINYSNNSGGTYIFAVVKNSQLNLTFEPSLIVFTSPSREYLLARWKKINSDKAEVKFFGDYNVSNKIMTEVVGINSHYNIYRVRGTSLSINIDWIAFE